MGFYLEFIHKTALIHFQSATLAQESLIDALQECLAQRVTQICVELPDNDAQLTGIGEVLLKLHNVLLKRGHALQILTSTGVPITELHHHLLKSGCTFALKPNSHSPSDEALSGAKKELKILKTRKVQDTAKSRAQKMLEDIKSQDTRKIFFDLDFKKIYKDADFQIFPDLAEKFLTVRAHLEMELRLKERLASEKNLYFSRIAHLKKVVDTDSSVGPEIRELQLVEEQYKNQKLELIDQYRTAGKQRTKLNMGEETRKMELESERKKLFFDLAVLRNK